MTMSHGNPWPMLFVGYPLEIKHIWLENGNFHFINHLQCTIAMLINSTPAAAVVGCASGCGSGGSGSGGSGCGGDCSYL